MTSNLIEGIKISIPSKELKDHLVSRKAHHVAKVEFYRERIADLEAGGIAEENVSNDPVSSLKSSLQSHMRRLGFFGFMADHVIPDSTYIITERDLTSLEIIDTYL